MCDEGCCRWFRLNEGCECVPLRSAVSQSNHQPVLCLSQQGGLSSVIHDVLQFSPH